MAKKGNVDKATMAVGDAAVRFWQMLLKSPEKPAIGDQGPVFRLCFAAFHLYQVEWSAQRGFDIADWKWPFEVLRNGEEFVGHEPSTVLLREAVYLACSKPLTGQA